MNKVYVGSGWRSKFGINVAIKKADIDKLPTNKYGDVLLEVVERKERNEKSGATHYVSVNQYAYDKLNATPADAVADKDDSGLPF